MATGIYLWECSPTKSKYIGQSENLRKDCMDFIRFNEPYGKDDKLNGERKLYPSLEYWKYTVLEKCIKEVLNEKEKQWQEKYNLEKKDDVMECHVRNIKKWYEDSLGKDGMKELYEMIRDDRSIKTVRLNDKIPAASSVDIIINGALAIEYNINEWETRSKIFSGLANAHSRAYTNSASISNIPISGGVCYYSTTNQLKFTLNKILYNLIMSEDII